MNDEEKNEGKQNFGSWREQNKPVDGFVSKEGFVIDESREQETVNSEQRMATPPPPKPMPKPKPGCSRLVKVLFWAGFILLVLFILWLFFFYKSSLEIAVSQTGSNITLDNKTISAGENSVKPGSYTLKIDKEGFVTYQKKIEMKYFRKTSVSIILKEMPKILTIYEKEANYLAYNEESDLFLFYLPAESAFYRLSTGDPVLVTPPQIKNLVDVIWNPNRLTAILKIKNDNAVLAGTPFYNPAVAENAVMTYLYDFGRYDLLHQEAHFWGTGIGDIEFTPKGDQVAYYFEPGTGEKSLVIANKDNSAMNRIADLRNFDNPQISWSGDLKNIILTNKSTNYSLNKVFILNLIDKTIKPLTDNGDNLGALFDGAGDKIVYTTFSSDPDFKNYSLLSVMDKDGQNKKELKIRSYLYQNTLNPSLGLLSLAEIEKDKYSLFSINLSDLKKAEYVFEGDIIAPSSIEYLEAKNSILFIDRNIAKILFLTTKDYE